MVLKRIRKADDLAGQRRHASEIRYAERAVKTDECVAIEKEIVCIV